MDFMHWELSLNDGDVVEVMSATQANIKLLTDSDFYSYRNRRSHNYYGGFFQYFPARIPAPYAGHWHVVLDLAGRRAMVRSSARVIPAYSRVTIPSPVSF